MTKLTNKEAVEKEVHLLIKYFQERGITNNVDVKLVIDLLRDVINKNSAIDCFREMKEKGFI